MTFGGILLAFRIRMLHGQQPIFNPLEMPATFSEVWLTRALTLNYLIAFNARLLIWPFRLSMDWSHGSIPLVESLTDPRVFVTLALYVLLVGLSWFAIRPMFFDWRRCFLRIANRSNSDEASNKMQSGEKSVKVERSFTMERIKR